MGSTVFRNPQALSSALAALGTLQLRALRFLNTVDTWDLASNYYIEVLEQMCFTVHVADQYCTCTCDSVVNGDDVSSEYKAVAWGGAVVMEHEVMV